MKALLKTIRISFVVALLFPLSNCEKRTNDQEQLYFLSDIRTDFFENLNFSSTEVVENIAKFRTEVALSYLKHEKNYLDGLYTSESDLEYMRLEGMYYSFYLLALGGNYNDGNITFENIMGNPANGFYSGLPSTSSDFQQKEMEAMMEEAARVGELAYQLNGFNDKAYGFYLSVKQVEGRLKNKGAANDASNQDKVINYVGTRMVNFELLPDWNVLMSMVTFTNYDDSLNSFKNPKMDNVLFNVNARLVPGALPDLGGVYPEIMGPMYRFDLNMKKMDWYLETTEEFTASEIEQLDQYIETLETASSFIETERTEILNTWDDRYTFDMRKDKLNEVRQFSEKLKQGLTNITKPELHSFINSKDFKKAYQCYSCHKPTGLNN